MEFVLEDLGVDLITQTRDHFEPFGATFASGL